MNLIRFLLASAVIISHTFDLRREDALEPMRRFLGWESLGSIAVFGFFFISGYLILKSALHSTSPEEYLVSRLLRIFPGLLILVLLCLAVLGPIKSRFGPGGYFSSWRQFAFLGEAVLHKAGTNGLPGVFESNPVKNIVDGSLWTLPLEWTMYMAVLLLCLFFTKWRHLLFRRCAILWASVFGSIILTIQMFPLNWSTVCVACYLVGSLCYLLRKRVVLSIPAAFLALCLNLAILYYAPLITYHVPFVAKRLFPLALSYFLVTVGFHPAILFRPFHNLGDYSYGLYIYAWPVQQLYVSHLSSAMTMLIFSYFSTLILAVLSWHLIENPCLAMKRAMFRARAFNEDSRDLAEAVLVVEENKA